jgi:putative CocE/NonD family hydrolase
MRAARRLWALGLLLPCSWSLAQNLDFHAPAHPDDADVPQVMQDLAGRVLPVYQENDQNLYLKNLSALQIVAGSYAAAMETLQTLRERLPGAEAARVEGRSILIDVFAQARVAQESTKVPFPQAFTEAYHNTVGRLNDQDAYTVTSWHGPPVSDLRGAVQTAFDQRRSSDAITVSDAVELIRIYFAYQASLLAAPLLGPLDAEDEQRRYVAEERVSIKTRDGATISAVLVRPKADGKPVPALLEFTIYVNSPNYTKECAAHGYAGIVAYTRETPDSYYRVAPFKTDGEDARAVIDWIIKQPWSDGRVGMYGGSYSGFTQWAAAKRLPAALKAIAASSPNAPGIDFPMRGGIYRNSAYRWAYNVTNKKGWDDTYNDKRWQALEETWYQGGKSYFEFDRTEEKPNLYFHSWLHHPSFDAFWRRLIPDAAELARINIPVLTTAGYYGGDLPGALYYYARHLRSNPQADHTLLIGPYDDGAMQRGPFAVLRGYPVDQAALIDLRELRYEWFDSVFKGTPKPALLSDRVNFEVMGANEWRHAASLDEMADARQRYFLTAADSADGHALSPQQPAKSSFVRQSVNFADRSDAGWRPPFNLIANELPLHNALKFISEPLSEPVELSGAISGRLDFTVNRLDVDLTVAAYEALPNGEYLALYDPVYAFRASYAADRAHRHLLGAGLRQQLSFRVERLTSRRLQAGSRIIIVLGVNKTPEQQINYGGGDDVSAEAMDPDSPPLAIRWYAGSYVDLPLRKDTAPQK